MRGRKHDVAIIGGGICGTAISHFCAQLGLDVLLMERGTIGGEGATRLSLGIVRVYDPSPQLMLWNREAVEIWSGWNIGGPTPFTSCGALYLLAPENIQTAVERARHFANAEYPIEIVRGTEIAERFGFLALQGRQIEQQIALFEPRGGYCEPRFAARLFAEAARGAGAVLLEGASVVSITEKSSIVEIRTSAESLSAKLVVVATGARAKELLPGLRMFSRSIPLTCFEHDGPIAECCVIDEGSGAYLRPESRKHFYCGGARQTDATCPDDLLTFDSTIHTQHRANVLALLGTHDVRPVAGLMGYDGYTADFLPIVGALPASIRILVASGFSGRGAKYIPALARRISAQIAKSLCSLQ